jgi:hypothetical protein
MMIIIFKTWFKSMACLIIIILNWTTYDILSIIREVDITKWESLGFHVSIDLTSQPV